MQMFKRYAVYYAPETGGFADAAARWLGWDAAHGIAVAQPAVPVPLAQWTDEPRKYGFHGTLKPPFRLAEAIALADLENAVADLARAMSVVQMPGLEMVDLAGFLALVPQGYSGGLSALAAAVVERLDRFRAPMTEAEVARRRPDRLTPRQRNLLARYGYPYVMEEFRFHLTLSGPLFAPDLAELRPLVTAHFAPHLPRPFRIADLCLFGEAEDGRFHLLHRYPLSG